MRKFPDDVEESKSMNISLAAAIFVVILLTFIEFVGDIIRIYVPAYTHWLEKIVILVILAMVFREIVRGQEYIQKIEVFLLKARKKSK